MDTIVINLFGEPSSGKSTCAMDITTKLKRRGIKAEYVSEFAKDKVWEKNDEVFKHQEYIFGKQSFKMGKVRGKVQVIVTDSPLFLSILYNSDEEVLGENFNQVVLDMFNSYHNKNYLLIRKHAYENVGRFQNEEQAFEVRHELIGALNKYKIPYNTVVSSEDNCIQIVNDIIEEINKNTERG